MMVVGFAAQKGQEPVKIIDPAVLEAKEQLGIELEAAAQAAANPQKEIAVPLNTEQDLSVKQQATHLEFNLQTPNNGGTVVNNPKQGDKIILNPDQTQIDYYTTQGLMRADGSLNDPESCPPHENSSRDEDVWLLMMDAYGDGWNGNVLTIDGVCAGLTGGSSGWASFGTLADGTYSVTCGGGSWASEVSWQIQDCCYGVLLEGTCPYDGSLVLGNFVFEAHSSPPPPSPKTSDPSYGHVPSRSTP
jgi:hypothetical protein